MNNQNKKGFTLVELIVVITILAVLWTISMLAFQSYTLNARDSVRVYDLNNIKSAIEYARVESGVYAMPDDGVDITYSWSISVWNQWIFWKDARTATKRLDKVPLDPLTENEYAFSVTSNGWEFELWAIMEWGDVAYWWPSIINNTYAATSYTAFVSGTYNWKVVKASSGWLDYIFAVPSIISSDLSTPTIEDITTNDKLVIKWYDSVPSNYTASNNEEGAPITWGHNFVNQEEVVVFEWTFKDLKENSDTQVELLSNLQKAYSWTVISSNPSIKEVLEIDTSTNPWWAQFVVQSLIKASIDKKFQITASSWSWSSVDSDSWDLPANITQIFAADSQFTKKWGTNSCDPANITVVDLEPGIISFPTSTPVNTLYRFQAWDYIISNTVQNLFTDCNALIWEPWETKIYTQIKKNHTFSLNGTNIIVHGIEMDGSSDWIGWTHINNWFGVLFSSSANNSTLSKSTISNFSRGVSLSNSSNNYLVNLDVFNSDFTGFYLYKSSNNDSLNINSYNNWTDGFSFYKEDLGNTLVNGNFYNNGHSWITFSSNSDYNSLSNINIFNNATWLNIKANSRNNAFNNINTFNNSWYWVSINTRYTKINDISTYNNTAYWIDAKWSQNLYFWGLKNFWNDQWNFRQTNGNDSKFNDWTTGFLWWNNGSLDSSDVFDSTFVVEPSVTWWDYSLRWKQTVTFDWVQNYTYGSSIVNQVQPIRYNGVDFVLSWIDWEDYDSSKKTWES